MPTEQVEAAVVLLEEALDRIRKIKGAYEDKGTLALLDWGPLVIEQLMEHGSPAPNLSAAPGYYIVTTMAGGQQSFVSTHMVYTANVGLHLAKEMAAQRNATPPPVLAAPIPPSCPVMVRRVSAEAAAAWPDAIWGDHGYHRPPKEPT